MKRNSMCASGGSRRIPLGPERLAHYFGVRAIRNELGTLSLLG